MNEQEFFEKVERAANQLISLCSTGEPSEAQVEDATRKAGLPISFEGESFVLDPIRTAVFVAAYKPSNARYQMALDNGLKWQMCRDTSD